MLTSTWHISIALLESLNGPGATYWHGVFAFVWVSILMDRNVSLVTGHADTKATMSPFDSLDVEVQIELLLFVYFIAGFDCHFASFFITIGCR
jgi:hypothetical protein